jgi:hypothetical protein
LKGVNHHEILKYLAVASLLLALSAGLTFAQDKVVITIAAGTVGQEKQLIDEAAAI